MMEIVPGVHRIECRFHEKRMVYVHLFVGTQASLLVDTGCAHNPQQEIIPYMQSIGLNPADLNYIVISHSDLDHQGGNAPMKAAAPRALLLCHNLDRPWIENTDALIEGRYTQFDADHGFETTEEGRAGIRAETLSAPVDMTLEGGERFWLSPDWYIEAVHTPGHSWGHLSVFDPRSRFMAAGEAALWNAILDTDWQPAMAPTYCYVDTYLATLERLMAMDIAYFSPAHWPLQEGTQIQEFLRESRNYCLFVESKLLALAQAGPYTLKAAIDRLAPEIGAWPAATNGALAHPFMGNLRRLVQRGQLVAGRDEHHLMTWSLPQ